MKRATVRDLRYRFPEIESRLRQGEVIEITKRRRVVGRLTPAKARKAPPRPPDFMAMLREIYGNKVMPVTGADLVARQRGSY